MNVDLAYAQRTTVIEPVHHEAAPDQVVNGTFAAWGCRESAVQGAGCRSHALELEALVGDAGDSPLGDAGAVSSRHLPPIHGQAALLVHQAHRTTAVIDHPPLLASGVASANR